MSQILSTSFKSRNLHLFHWLQNRCASYDLPTYVADLISLLQLTSIIQNAHIYSAEATILILARKSGCLWAFFYWFFLDKIFIYVNLKPSIPQGMCYTSGIEHEPNSSRKKQFLQRRCWTHTHTKKTARILLLLSFQSIYIYTYIY